MVQKNRFRRRQVWLFVRVIDYYGDIGVAWRLAYALHQRQNAQVHLWVDDVAALSLLAPYWPQADDAVAVHVWGDDAAVAHNLAALPPANCVIEAFGCDVPAPVRSRLAADKPLWLNWEYLSAEDWALEAHGLPSLQGNGVAKYFWFMGFDKRSGGLLREADYAAQQAAFGADKAAQQVFRQHYGLPENPRGQTVLLFAYASPVWADWLALWQSDGVPVTVWLAGSQVADSLRDAGVIAAGDLRLAGDAVQQGCVRLLRIPFVPQAEFDRLLWLADWAVVRGEDSFVRAQWAGLPFFWHIYAQDEAAHVLKLRAFWRRASSDWGAVVRQAHRCLSEELNGATRLAAHERQDAWQCLQQDWPQWRQGAATWSQKLMAQPDALEKLASFMQDKLK